MSIPFTSLGPEDADKAGYFRIGHVILKTPPTDILTNRVSGKERITVLRGSNDLVKLTGKGRWDITVRWIAMLDDTASNVTDRYAQWEDLRSIVAIFKVAPFVEIENYYIRQVLCEQDPTVSNSMRMGFGLRQLRVSTHPDIIDALDCSLTMTWFNYFPYTSDFSYQVDTVDGGTVPGDALDSSEFAAYIEAWKANNLYSNSNPFYDGPPAIDYTRQDPGVLKLNWREYRTVKIAPAVIVNETPTQAINANAPQLTASGTHSMANINPTTKWDPLIQKYAAQYGLSPAMVKAVMMQETKCGSATSVGANFQGAATTAGSTPNQVTNYLRLHIQTDADGGVSAVNTYTQQNQKTWKSGKVSGLGPDLGLMQLQMSTAVKYSGNANLRPVDLFDPDTNIRTACAYLAHLYASGMTDQTLGAYNNGSVSNPVQSYSNQVYAYFQQFAIGNVPDSIGSATSAQPALASASTIQPKSAPTTPASQTTSLSSKSASDALLASLSKDDQDTINQMLANGWQLDFSTNDLAYFYVTHELELADADHKSPDNTIVMPPRQISILMVNNLAQIPLASYQYPTYQHVGSPSSEVSIGFTSVGTWLIEGTEPKHTGISVLGGLISFLEAQYLSFRTNMRSVRSLHRFHAVMADNQILNMLGIRGLTLDNLSTETVPDASDLVQVELSGKQYENIFESIDSYKIRTIESAALGVTQSLVNSNTLQNLDPSEQKVVPTLTAFANARNSYSLSALDPYILQIGALPNSNLFQSFDNTDRISVPSDIASQMLTLIIAGSNAGPSPLTSAIASGVSGLPGLGGLGSLLQTTGYSAAVQNRAKYPNIASRMDSVKTSGVWTAGDVELIHALASTSIDSVASGDPVQIAWNDSLAQIGVSNKTRIQAIYDDVFTILSGTNTTFAQEINTLAASPTYAAQYQAAFDSAGPALSQDNTQGQISDHTAYRDMGLRTLSVGTDNNPGSYFINHSTAYEGIVRNLIDAVVNGASKTVQSVNASTTSNEYYQAITNTDLTGLNADTASLVKMTNIPGLSMAEAFPTFKLFLMEDEAGGLINCYDNFYSYASVTDLEVIRYQDRPDVAVIQITNLSNLLTHHLYDATLMGRYTASLRQKWETPATSGDQVTGGGASDTVQYFVNKNLAGQTYQILGDGMKPNQNDRIPLQYVALQPGSKIQIRMGYANNPDSLTPVFTGRVTQINTEDDMMVITAESFLGELCTIPTYSGQPQKARDFGAEWTSNDSGDTGSVVEYLLKADQARHFGGFKLATVSDPLVTGLTWQNRLGKAIGEFSVGANNIITEVGAALASSYDRSGENILINHIINSAGAATAIRNSPIVTTRSFEDPSSSNMYLKFTYHVKKDSTFTTWDLIKDVCRRYPEYIVTAKQYGFPYSADATMLVAHPLDWYFARPPMIGDVERYHTGLSQDAEWNQWWQAQGKALWDVMVTKVTKDMSYLSEGTTRAKLAGTGQGANTFVTNLLTAGGYDAVSGNFSKNYPTGPADMDDKMQSFLQAILTLTGLDAGKKDPNWFASLLYGADVGAEKTLNYLLSVPNMLLGGGNLNALLGARYRAVQGDMIAVRDSWMRWLQLKDPKPFDRLKPVRRYHFIDHNTIVHNGMIVNDKIYNGIKVREDVVMANGHIPPHYRRVLDVTSMLNDPEHNLDTQPIRSAVGQSFLREEVGKMYDGEIILRGTPEIEPYDCLVILDPSTAITGIVEVGKVIHSFSQEAGFITIVTPRCLVGINESASAGMARMFNMIMAKALFTGNGLYPGGGLNQTWNSFDNTQKAIGIGGTAAAVGGTVALIALAATPPGWVAAILGGVLLFGGVLVTGFKNETANNIQVLPVSRFGRPWMGGLEGYQIADMWQNLGSTFKEWEADNIYPLIDTYRLIHGAQTNALAVQGAAPAVPAGSTPALNPPVGP